MRFNPFYYPTTIGLDIQFNTLRLVQLKRTRRGFSLELALQVDIAELFEQEKIKNFAGFVSVLSELVHNNKLKDKKTVLNVNSHHVKMSHLSLPIGLNEKDLDTEIRASLRQDNLTPTHYRIDFWSLQNKEQGYQDVHFAALPEANLQPYITGVEQSGLNLKIIEIDIYSLKRVMEYAFPDILIQNKASAVFYVIDQQATLLIFDIQKIIFYQKWLINNVNDLMQQFSDKIFLWQAVSKGLGINQFILCGADSYLQHIAKESLRQWALDIHFLQLDSLELKNPQVNAVDFLFAIGAAMRETSRW